MLDRYESIKTSPSFVKFSIGDLLFAQYTCPIATERLEVFAHSDYLVHVISGKKIWYTTDGEWIGTSGETLFFRKGAAVVEQFFDADFCLLMFFIPDRIAYG